MRPDEILECTDFTCQDVDKKCFVVPDIEIDPDKIRVLMVSEAPTNISSGFF